MWAEVWRCDRYSCTGIYNGTVLLFVDTSIVHVVSPNGPPTKNFVYTSELPNFLLITVQALSYRNTAAWWLCPLHYLQKCCTHALACLVSHLIDGWSFPHHPQVTTYFFSFALEGLLIPACTWESSRKQPFCKKPSSVWSSIFPSSVRIEWLTPSLALAPKDLSTRSRKYC